MGMEEVCIGGQGKQWTVVIEDEEEEGAYKKKM
jgi:hypothetical protein